MAIVWRNSSLLRRLAAPAGLAIIERMERECLRRSRVVTALSQFTIDCIARIHGNGVARSVRLMPGWVDTSKFVPLENRDLAKRQLGWPVDVPVLFTLRRLAPRMGLDRLLHACQRLHSEQIRFHLMIGGTGPIRKDLEELARALGLKDVVTFLGRIADRELPTAYGACDAFVLPTAELECFGLIALEALAAGRPVLATPVGAIPEIIARFQPAWLSRSAKTDDFSDLLRRYFAGALPVRGSAELHDQADREFSRRVRLPNFLESTIGGLSIR
jgi:glycosyltransferase involved in cell wall biosynthesis